MNRRRHFVLVIVPALILVASTALYPGHFFYPASNQPHSVRIGPQVLAFYRNLLNLRLLFKNQKKLRLSSVVSFLNVAERYAKKN